MTTSSTSTRESVVGRFRTFIHRVRLAAAAIGCIAVFGVHSAAAQMAVHPNLDPSIAQNLRKIKLGDWGESVVENMLRERGFEVVDPMIGGQGLDRIAYKRGADGQLIDVRAIEVKARTDAGNPGLPGNSLDGKQLTDTKLRADLSRAASQHADPKVRGLAGEVERLYRANPDAVRVERHVLTVKDGRYTVYDGASTARPVGRPPADGSLENVFSRLSQSPNRQTAAAARMNRAYLASQRTALEATGEEVAVARAAVARAASKPTGLAGTVSPLGGAVTGAVTAGAATSAVVAGVAMYDWYQGEISDDRLYEELIRAGGDGIAVSLATGAVLLMTPAAPGVVLIAVAGGAAIAADLAFDWAMERENEHLVERELRIRYGFVPKPEDADRRTPTRSVANPLREQLERLRSERVP